jgi:hypothetical protein
VGAKGCWHVLTWISAIGPVIAILILVKCYKLRDKEVGVIAMYNNGEISKEECERKLREL